MTAQPLTYYAGLSAPLGNWSLERLIRNVASILAPIRILRTISGVGNSPFVAGAALGRGAYEIYPPEVAQPWAVDMVKSLWSATLDARIINKAASSVQTVLGQDGKTPSAEVICAFSDVEQHPSIIAIHVAIQYNIPVHNLLIPNVFQTWEQWVIANKGSSK